MQLQFLGATGTVTGSKYLLRHEGNVSLPQIGEVVGGRDHTTVIYACEKVADMMERDELLRRQVLQIREQLYGKPAAK